MTIRTLPRIVPLGGDRPQPPAVMDQMQQLTREVAFDVDGWTPRRATEMRDFFDELAPGWHKRDRPERIAVIRDAIERGGPFKEGLALELGSGTGLFTATIASALSRLVAIDLSVEMLRLAPKTVPRLRADASRLPFADGTAATLVLVNMLLFPAEVDRVLRASGAIVWVSTNGSHTPIYLSATDLEASLPGDWDIITSEAGFGSWCVARRA